VQAFLCRVAKTILYVDITDNYERSIRSVLGIT
jgi:hypothetical protein